MNTMVMKEQLMHILKAKTKIEKLVHKLYKLWVLDMFDDTEVE